MAVEAKAHRLSSWILYVLVWNAAVTRLPSVFGWLIFSLLSGVKWNDMWIYPTIFRRDILADEIFAIPLEYLSVFDGGFLVRTLEGKEIISYLWAIEAIIEGQTWRETTDGYRLPDTVLETESTIYAAEMLPLQSTEDWKAKHPGETCTLWEHENVCKRRLLDAEKRKGLTNVALITEKTPVGWHRIYDGYDLVQDES